jgi:hypothetical protein
VYRFVVLLSARQIQSLFKIKNNKMKITKSIFATAAIDALAFVLGIALKQ